MDVSNKRDHLVGLQEFIDFCTLVCLSISLLLVLFVCLCALISLNYVDFNCAGLIELCNSRHFVAQLV